MGFNVHDSALRKLYDRQPDAVAFVDEAYQGAGIPNRQPFYIVGAVVVPFERLEALRGDLMDIAGSMHWHTRDAFRPAASAELRETLKKLVTRLADDDSITLCTIDTEATHFTKLEQVRRFALVSLARVLVQGHGVDLFVYERRREGMEENTDRETERLMQADPVLRSLRAHGGTPYSEPLLWAPDLVASTLRRRVAVKEHEWFEPLRSKTTVHIAGTNRAGVLPPKQNNPRGP